MTTDPLRVGVLGCGNISDVYLANAARFADAYQVVACADIDPERARAKADAHGVARTCSPDELLADPEVEVVLSLTPPAAHGPVGMAALEAGKHLYTEKPLCAGLDDARALVESAGARGLLVGCAPDTVLGAGYSTCRRLIDAGAIGTPFGGSVFMMCPGHESWHPDPDFFYQPGAGPLFDMGPYYLTALVHLLGPIRAVSASAAVARPTRTIATGPRAGQAVEVATPTHITGSIDFHSGAVVTAIFSFETWHHTLPCAEIYGTAGTLMPPDPNAFGGPVRLRMAEDTDWRDVELVDGPADNARGLGLVDLHSALRRGTPHRTSAGVALHVVEAMHAFLRAAESGRRTDVLTPCDRPAPWPGE